MLFQKKTWNFIVHLYQTHVHTIWNSYLLWLWELSTNDDDDDNKTTANKYDRIASVTKNKKFTYIQCGRRERNRPVDWEARNSPVDGEARNSPVDGEANKTGNLVPKEFGKDVGGEYRWQQKTVMKREIMVAQWCLWLTFSEVVCLWLTHHRSVRLIYFPKIDSLGDKIS